MVAVQRQLRALDVLAEESGAARIAFFASSRRAMHVLVTGNLDLADRLIARSRALGAQAAEPDLEAVAHSLAAARARQAGDVDALRREAAAHEEYGAAEGVPSVAAEAAVLWLDADEPDRALALLDQLAGAGLGAVARDVDFLLTVASLVEVAAALHRDGIAADGARLLEPYAGRAVLNAGAVVFLGLAGRRRRFSSADERARVAVRKAIAAALDRSGRHDAALARLLRDTVRTGAACRYDPDPARPVTWLLDDPAGKRGSAAAD